MGSRIVKKLLNYKFLIPLFIVFVTIYDYFFLYKTYFQSDEWYYFSKFLPLTKHNFGFIEALYKSIAQTDEISGGGHLAPIYNVFWYIHNYLFGIQFLPYIISSLGFHIMNSILIFFLVQKIVKNISIATISSIFFALSASHHQAFTWVMAYIPTEVSVTFLLLSLLALPLDITKNNIYKKYLGFSFFFFICALLTKESSVIFFFILPLFSYLFTGRKIFIKTIRYSVYTLIFYIPFRFITPLLFPEESHTSFLLQLRNQPLGELITHTFIFPIKVLSHIFFPQDSIFLFAEKVTPFINPHIMQERNTGIVSYTYFVQEVVSNYLIYISSGIIMLLIIILLLQCKKRIPLYMKGVIFGSLFIVSSALPLVLIPLYAPWWGKSTFIDSRHIYLGSIGGSLLFGITVWYVSDVISRFQKQLTYSTSLIIWISLILIVWIIPQFYLVQNDLKKQEVNAVQRKEIIHVLLDKIHTLNGSTILLSSDTPYYGFYNIPPFQSNIGGLLPILFYEREKVPDSVLMDNYFFYKSLTDGGVITADNYEFGYFPSDDKFFKYLETNSTYPNTKIHSFLWKGEENTLVDTTEEKKEMYMKKFDDLQQIKKWKRFQSSRISFSYPAKYSVQSVNTQTDKLETVVLNTGSVSYRIILFEKNKTIPFHEYILDSSIKEMLTLEGENVVTNINRPGGELETVVFNKTVLNEQVLIPSYNGKYYIQVKPDSSQNLFDETMQLLISTIQINED